MEQYLEKQEMYSGLFKNLQVFALLKAEVAQMKCILQLEMQWFVQVIWELYQILTIISVLKRKSTH